MEASQNPMTTAANLRTRLEKRTHIQRTIDAHHFDWLVWAVASSSFLADSYSLFAANVFLPSVVYVYWPDDVSGIHSSVLDILTLTGSLLGQLAFGYLADRYGRTQLYGFGLIIMIISTIGVATSSTGWNGSMSITAMLYSWRFVMGFGIGAEYPLGAIITAEWASTRSRARMMAAIFLMQPVGRLVAQLVGIWVLLGFNRNISFQNSTEPEYCKPILDKTWRWIAGAGAIPCFFAMILRWTIANPGRFTLDVKDKGDRAVQETISHYSQNRCLFSSLAVDLSDVEGLDATQQSGSHTVEEDGLLPTQFSCADMKLYFLEEGNWRYLAGTSICWFLLDFAFYGLAINSPRSISKLWASKPVSDEVINVPSWVSDPTLVTVTDKGNLYPPIYRILLENGKRGILTVSIGSVAGSLVLIMIVNYIPRKTFLIRSFLVLAVCLAITGGTYFAVFHTGSYPLSIVLYALCQFLFSLGPNTLTYIIPAEIFPTRYRCTCHGISSAFGQLGSVIVQAMLPHLSFDGVNISNPDSEGLGWLFIIFSFVIASGSVFAWAWVPNVQEEQSQNGYELPSKTLEDLSGGLRAAENDGQTIGFRKKLRRTLFLLMT